jgi:hypothetical protein
MYVFILKMNNAYSSMRNLAMVALLIFGSIVPLQTELENRELSVS